MGVIMNIDLGQLGKVAGLITGAAAAGAVLWSLNPFALAEDVDSEIKRLERLFLQSTLEAAEHQADYYQQQLDQLNVRQLEIQQRQDIDPTVKQQFMQSLTNETRRKSQTLERAQSRVRALRPVIRPSNGGTP